MLGMKIIAFPFAGGNMYSYDFLKPFLKKYNVDLKVFEYAGRGSRYQEKLATSVDEIAKDLYAKTVSYINKNEQYVIYGHSMGALIAYTVCHKLEEHDLNNPLRLIVSGRKAPSVNDKKKIADYPSKEFWKEVIEFGGIPKEMQKEKALLKFFEPILKADFKAVEEYEHQVIKPLTTSLDVMYAESELDHELDFLNWQKETIQPLKIKSYKGDHFFIYEHAKEIANNLILGIK